MSALGPRIASPWAGHTVYLPTLHGKGPTITSVLAPALGIGSTGLARPAPQLPANGPKEEPK